MRCAVPPSCNRDGPEQRRDGRRWYQRARCSAGDGDIFIDGVNGYSHRTCYVLAIMDLTAHGDSAKGIDRQAGASRVILVGHRRGVR
jgi:hypothetical protein